MEKALVFENDGFYWSKVNVTLEKRARPKRRGIRMRWNSPMAHDRGLLRATTMTRVGQDTE